MELLCSFFLLSILMGFIFTCFTHLTKAQKQLQKTKQTLLNYQSFQVRMNQIFSSLVAEEKIFFTYPSKKNASQQNLFFYFDNQIDPDPAFSGKLYGKIFQEKDTLYLQTLSQNEEHIRIEALASPITHWEMQYLLSTSPGIWQTRLKASQRKIPPLIKITLYSSENISHSFAFFPTASFEMIFYSGEKKL